MDTPVSQNLCAIEAQQSSEVQELEDVVQAEKQMRGKVLEENADLEGSVRHRGGELYALEKELNFEEEVKAERERVLVEELENFLRQQELELDRQLTQQAKEHELKTQYLLKQIKPQTMLSVSK